MRSAFEAATRRLTRWRCAPVGASPGCWWRPRRARCRYAEAPFERRRGYRDAGRSGERAPWYAARPSAARPGRRRLPAYHAELLLHRRLPAPLRNRPVAGDALHPGAICRPRAGGAPRRLLDAREARRSISSDVLLAHARDPPRE